MPDLERGGYRPARGYSWPPFQPQNAAHLRSGFWSSPMLREDDREEVEEIAASVRDLMPVYRPEFELAVEQLSCRLWRQRRAYRDLSENGVVRDGQPASVLRDLATLENSNTLRRYRENLTCHVIPALGRRRLGSVTVDDVAALLGDLQRQGYAAWTCRGVLVVLGRLLGSAARRGLIASNPCSALERSERPKVTRAEFPSLDSEAVGRLIAATPDRYRVLIAVSVLLGLRQGEPLGLQWRDVDTREGSLRVRRQLSRDGALVEPKTQAAKREIPMPPSLARMLAEPKLASLHKGESDFVFCSSAGTPLGVRNIVRRGLEPALAAAGLPRMRWHDLRHVAASLLIAEGASVGYVSRLLGHASPAITLGTYSHEFARAEHDAVTRERMEAAFGEVLR